MSGEAAAAASLARSPSHPIRADLVVVAHRKQSLLSRWWSGDTDAFLSDHVGCSLLVSRSAISDEAFEAKLAKLKGEPPV